MWTIDDAVTRQQIDAAIRSARFEGHDPARWALPLVASADERCGGRWSLVVLTPQEVRALWLPAHAGEPCHGDTAPLAGGAGGALDDCSRWLLDNADDYARRNPSCWSRIEAARGDSWGPLVVAPFSVGDRIGAEAGSLVVIDGLHRAIGWAMRAHQTPLEVFLAGPAVSGPR